MLNQAAHFTHRDGWPGQAGFGRLAPWRRLETADNPGGFQTDREV